MKLPQIGREKFKRKENARCHRDQDDVVKKGPEEILAAFAMAMSSITVVSNSLRLYRARID